MSVCWSVHHFGPDQNISTTTKLDWLQFCTDIPGPQRMNPSYFGFLFFFIEISTIIGWIVIKLATCIYCPQIINTDDFSDPLTSPLAPPEGWHLCFWLKHVPDELNSAFILEILCRKFRSPPLLRREEGGAAFIWVLSHLALILQVCVFVCAHCMTGHLHSCLFCGQHM